MEPATYAPATSYSLGALVRIFNRAFAGYSMPITQTEETLAAMIANNDVSLADSLVMLDGAGEPLGINLLALRPPRGWIAGMGVDADRRGQGHGAALMRAIITRARARGLAALHLEVLEHNEPARRLYTALGFRETRLLRVFNGVLARHPDTPRDGTAVVSPVAVADALARFDAWHPNAPSWQREAPSLAHLAPRLRAHELRVAGEPRAYALHAPSSAGVALLDAGAAPGAGAVAALTELLLAITDGMERAPLRAINVPPDDPLGEALAGLGCAVLTRQVEMALPLAPDAP
ncbi:MAG TPA: GNAT family N-acetyltransferase [Ktedonobacterales bacterium]